MVSDGRARGLEVLELEVAFRFEALLCQSLALEFLDLVCKSSGLRNIVWGERSNGI